MEEAAFFFGGDCEREWERGQGREGRRGHKTREEVGGYHWK